MGVHHTAAKEDGYALGFSAILLFRLALACPNEVQAMIRRVNAYCRAEDVEQHDYLQRALAADWRKPEADAVSFSGQRNPASLPRCELSSRGNHWRLGLS